MISSSRYGLKSSWKWRPKLVSALPYGRAVIVGQVDMGDAQVERRAQHLALGGKRRRVAEVMPQAQ